ncbi:MAG: methylated-DNA--[protein]-cysteine S-methyltransferase [Dermatophilaceae bacterium]
MITERVDYRVAYRVVDSPIGPVLVAATRRGLVRVAFECQGFDAVLGELAAKVGPLLSRAPAWLDAAAGELEEYFAGSRRAFSLPLDLTLSSGFRGEVHRLLTEIPYGSTRSYKDVAALAGNLRAVRAVGTACARNPLPIVVPCHRVLRSDGSLGGYAGGLPAKRLLLRLEGSSD